MTAKRAKWLRMSVCATCLSQDRALFPVNVQMLKYGFSVHEHDRVCWECLHFVSKITAFNNRALQAQAILKDWLKGKISKADSLSGLGESTGLILDIPTTPAVVEETTFRIELIKQETDDEAYSEAVPDAEAISDEAPETNESKKKEANTIICMPESCYHAKTMTEEEMLKWRERKKTLEYYTSSIPTYRCEKCIEGFFTQIEIDRHMRKHSEVYGTVPCPVCERRFPDDLAMAQHKKRHYSLLTCSLCGHEWDSPNAMRQHGGAAHGAPVTLWDCDHCDRKFPTEHKVVRHEMQHRVTPCRTCGKLIGRNSLKAHMRVHLDDGVPARTCAVCGAQYRGDQGLAAHMLAHGGVPHNLLKCEHCDKCFQQRSSLRAHVDSAHGDSLNHACDACGQLFRTRSAARTHGRRAHAARPARDKVCDHCGKAFTTKRILAQHINTHTGARPYACGRCGATFGHASALYLHGRYKHGVNQGRRSRPARPAGPQTP